jgi:hypothetical protein
MRLGLLLLVVASPALADTAKLAPDVAGKLAKGGWANAEATLATGKLTVVNAKKGGKHHVVFVTASGAIVDAGQAPVPEKLTATAGRTAGLGDLTEVVLEYRALRDHGGAEHRAWIWLVREDGSVACKLTGSDSTSLGTACGSSGWTNISLRANGTTLEVIAESSGNFSEKTANGTCRPRSPVRPGRRTTRYELPAKGTCKERKP